MSGAVTAMSLAHVVLRPHAARMFLVDEATAASIRRAFMEDGELSAVIEFRRHFPLISDHAKALECAQIIAGWGTAPLVGQGADNVVRLRPRRPKL